MARKKGGLLFGIIMGTLMGVLFAPGKGKELRSRIVKEIDDGGLGTKALGNDFKMMGRDIADTAQDVYEDPRVQGGVKKGRKSIKQMFGELRKRFTGLISSSKKTNDEKGSAKK